MKQLIQYIHEALRNDVHKWLENVYQKTLSFIKDNKVKSIKVDVNKLAKPNKGGFEYDDFMTDTTVKNFLNNNLIGFTVINQMIQNPKKYLITSGETQQELKPECLPYWFQGEQNVYFVGLILFDTTITYIDEYVNLIAIETSLFVEDSLPVYKAILNDFSLHYLNKKGNYKGISVKPTHPKMKAILQKIGFKPYQENKDILIYKL